MPSRALLAGMGFALSQPPLAYWKKSALGETDLSRVADERIDRGGQRAGREGRSGGTCERARGERGGEGSGRRAATAA